MNQINQGDISNLMQSRYNELYNMYEKVLRENEELEQLTKADVLTGLFSRRYMMRKLQEEGARTLRSKRIFSAMICKVDNLAELEENDDDSEVMGYVLREIAGLLTSSCRNYDMLSRWDEDSFMMLLPETDLTWAMVVAERCRKNTESFVFEHDGKQFRLSLSVGMTEFRQSDGVGGCTRRAEHAARDAAQRGGNCIVFSSISGSEVTYLTYTAER
jgi:diguanylate cyclase (GGDEF)-like protein